MTDINSGFFTVHNSTATTFELFTESTSTIKRIATDGTSFSAYTSGGTAKHTTLVLNDVQGEFVGGETIRWFIIKY